MNTLFVAEAREAAAFLEEAYEATFSPDPLPNPLSRPATPIGNVAMPEVVVAPLISRPTTPIAEVVPPAIAEVRPMPRPNHQPEQGYFLVHRNPNGSFSNIKTNNCFRFAFARFNTLGLFFLFNRTSNLPGHTSASNPNDIAGGTSSPSCPLRRAAAQPPHRRRPESRLPRPRQTDRLVGFVVRR